MSVVSISDRHLPLGESAVVLLLAGGSSLRFGGDKRLAILDAGNTLISQSISRYESLGLQVIVCLSAASRDDMLAATLHKDAVAYLRCKRSEEGMGSTLAEGVAAFDQSQRIVIALADMPVLMPETVSQLLIRSTSDNIVFPVCDGKRGHPVVFGRRFFAQLKALSGERGASKILGDNSKDCVSVLVDDPGVLLDVDTPEDLKRLS